MLCLEAMVWGFHFRVAQKGLGFLVRLPDPMITLSSKMVKTDKVLRSTKVRVLSAFVGFSTIDPDVNPSIILDETHNE